MPGGSHPTTTNINTITMETKMVKKVSTPHILKIRDQTIKGKLHYLIMPINMKMNNTILTILGVSEKMPPLPIPIPE